jgi:hypothetical protein
VDERCGRLGEGFWWVFSGVSFSFGVGLTPCFPRDGRVMANIFEKALKQLALPTITITKVL